MKNNNTKLIAIIALIVLIAGVLIAVVLISNKDNSKESNNTNVTSNEENSNSNKQEEPKELTYIDMYSKYLKENFFDKEEMDKFTGGFYSMDAKNPVLVVKYQDKDNNFYIRVLHISGEEVLTSDNYKATSIHYFYNLDTEKVEYFIKHLDYRTDYKSILDMINNKSTITAIREDDFNQKFVPIEEQIEFYTVESSSLERDLNKLDTMFKETDESVINEAVKEIENRRVKMDDNGIYNAKYRAAFGTYVYSAGENTKITLKKDNSVHEDGWLNGGWDGSFYLQYDQIRTKMTGLQSSNKDFIIIGDNKLQRVSDKTIWNLAK